METWYRIDVVNDDAETVTIARVDDMDEAERMFHTIANMIVSTETFGTRVNLVEVSPDDIVTRISTGLVRPYGLTK